MLESSMTVQKTFRYALEPGDGTHYAFSITECANHNHTIIGVSGGADYVTFTLHSPGFGTYEVSKYLLRHPARHLVDYLSPHFKAIAYTMMAVLLAASVLVDDSDDLEGACQKMLQVSDYL